MARPKKGDEHPRDKLRPQIEMMVASGIPQTHIAGILGMSLTTLHKHYKDELELGTSKANAIVGSRIFQAARAGMPWACGLWASRRMGWKETTAVEHTGRDGGPIRSRFEMMEPAQLQEMIDREYERRRLAGGDRRIEEEEGEEQSDRLH